MSANSASISSNPMMSSMTHSSFIAAAMILGITSSMIHSTVGLPTSTPADFVDDETQTVFGNDSIPLSDQEVIFTPHVRSVEFVPAKDPSERKEVHPDQDVIPEDGEDYLADRCPRPAYPINRETYCSPALKRCSRDEECSGATSVCCFNGCIFTCMLPMDAPAHFDWVEDAGIEGQQPLGQEIEHLESLPVKYDDPSLRTAPKDAAAAPDDEDCHLSASQYKTLQEFRHHDGIRECFCQDGQILCKVGRG